MKPKTQLKLCDWALIPLCVFALASGIQVEMLHGGPRAWVWTHVAVCLLFMAGCAWHVWLHFKKTNWFSRMRRQKSQVTRILWWTALLTLLSGLAAMVHWIAGGGHSPLGGVHGKLGFLMIILAAAHAIHRRRFFRL